MTAVTPLYFNTTFGRITQLGSGDVLNSGLFPASSDITTGSAIISFGTGSNEASVTVNGLTTISSTLSNITLWISVDDATSDHSASDHKYVSTFAAFTAGAITDNTGFTIYGRSQEKLSGTYKVRYSYANTSASILTSTFARNVDWPTNGIVANGFSGLFAVYNDDSNYLSVSANSNYNVSWGDGSSSINQSGQASHSYSYASISSNIVGTSAAVNVSFTDTGDLVNLTAHGFQNGQAVSFATISTTTGITTNVIYYVVNKTTNSFQVSTSLGGSAIALTLNGIGTLFIPAYKIVKVIITPATGYNLTTLDLTTTNPTTSKSSYPWLDIVISSSALTSLTLQGLRQLTIANLYKNSLTSFASMFANCYSLQSISSFDTSFASNFSSMFSNCYALQSIPLLNTALGTNFSSMFSGCYTLQTIPLLNTAAGTNFSSMFANCYALQSIPLISTAAGTNFSSMFSTCNSLKTVPLINTALGTNFSSMFTQCASLLELPALNLSSATSLASMVSSNANLGRATFIGTPVDISYASCNLSATELNSIYTNLATVGSATITVTSNYGTSGDTPSIATAKNWTVVGS